MLSSNSSESHAIDVEALRSHVLALDLSEQLEILNLLQEQLGHGHGSAQSSEGSADESSGIGARAEDMSLASESGSGSTGNFEILHVTEESIIAAIADDITEGATEEMEVSGDVGAVSDEAEDSSLGVSGSQSGISPRSNDDSAETTLGNARFNSQVLLVINPVKTSGQIFISFTSERSNTSLGSIQGRHTIPERLLLEFIAKTIAGKTLAEIPEVLYGALCDSVEGFAHESLSVKPVMILYPDNDKHKKLGIRLLNAQAVANYVSQTIERYNILWLSVFPCDGHVVPGEGAKVSANMTMLRAINEFLSLEIGLDGNFKIEDISRFYEGAVLVNGRFVEGMKNFFGAKDIKQIRSDYPRRPDKINEFCEEFSKKCTERKVGQLLSEIFDFPYKESAISTKDPERTQKNLHILTRRCLKMCLKAFPQIAEKLDPVEIGMEFERQVIEKIVKIKVDGENSKKQKREHESGITEDVRETKTLPSWTGHAVSQDWDTVFPPLNKIEIINSLVRAKEVYLQSLGSGIQGVSRFIDVVNESFEMAGIKFALKAEDHRRDTADFEALVDSILDSLRVVTSEASRFVAKRDLTALIKAKSQEVAQVSKDLKDKEVSRYEGRQ